MKMPKVFVLPVVMIAIIVVLVLLFKRADSRRDREEGRLLGRIDMLEHQRDSLRVQARIHDTLYRADTVRLTKAVTTYQVMKDSVLVRLTDTLLVKEFIQQSDTTIKACKDALSTCELRVADRDRIIANERATRAAADSLWRVRFKKATPRLVPYMEAGAVATESQTYYARAGAEMRVIGAIRLTGALEATKIPNHTTTAARVGLRVNFR